MSPYPAASQGLCGHRVRRKLKVVWLYFVNSKFCFGYFAVATYSTSAQRERLFLIYLFVQKEVSVFNVDYSYTGKVGRLAWCNAAA
jgi:hypothetical protein